MPRANRLRNAALPLLLPLSLFAGPAEAATRSTQKDAPPASLVVVGREVYPEIRAIADPFAIPLEKGGGERSAKMRHLLSEAPPAEWSEILARVSAAGSVGERLRVIDEAIDHRLKYATQRVTHHDGWVPLRQAFDVGSVCVAYATAKYALLTDTGTRKPADLRVMTVTGTAPGKDYHVVLLARYEVEEPARTVGKGKRAKAIPAKATSRVVVLDMTDRSGPGRAIPWNEWRSGAEQGGRGLVWLGNTDAGADLSRAAPPALVETAPSTPGGMKRGRHHHPVEAADNGHAGAAPPSAGTGNVAEDLRAAASAPIVLESLEHRGVRYQVQRAPGNFTRLFPAS